MDQVGVKLRPNEALRHAFGTELAARLLQGEHSQADASRLIMAIMGHTEFGTSMRYVKLATASMGHLIRGRK
jgi:integrase